MNETREILEQGISSAFWKLFCEHVNQEWGAGGQRFAGTIEQLANMTTEDAVLVNQMRQIAVARREILRLLLWPHEELKRQTASETPHVPQGRAPMAEELVGMSRRGGL